MGKKRSNDQAVEDKQAPSKKLKSSSVSDNGSKSRVRDVGSEQVPSESKGILNFSNLNQDTYL